MTWMDDSRRGSAWFWSKLMMTKLRAMILWFGYFCVLHKIHSKCCCCWLLRCAEVLPCGAHDFVSSIYAWQWMLFLRNHVIYRRLKENNHHVSGTYFFTVLPFSINDSSTIYSFLILFLSFWDSSSDSIENVKIEGTNSNQLSIGAKTTTSPPPTEYGIEFNQTLHTDKQYKLL